MRRRRQKQIGPAVSLFPFLAVLICTLGVLIVLLVLAVQTASTQKVSRQQEQATEKARQQQAQAKVQVQAKQRRVQRRAKQVARIETLADEIDRHEVEAEAFEADRPRLRRDVAHARDYRAHLESELKSLKTEASQLMNHIKLLSTDLLAIETVVEDDELQSLREQVVLAEQQLAEKRANTVLLTEKKYAIVPYHGTGGTGRVPVFLECDAEGVTLQPWNIRITKQDFFQPVSAGNPIDAALAAVKGYFNEHQLASRDQRPYPLLVVRPGGAQSYGLARRALVSWDDEFGYELVTEDKDLDFGEVDSQLQEEVSTAVAKSKQIQLALKRRRGGQFAGLSGSRGTRFASEGESNGGSTASAGSAFSNSFASNSAASERPSNEGGDFKGQSDGTDGGFDSDRPEPIFGGDFRQASFQGGAAGTQTDRAEAIETSFQSGAVSNADGSFSGSAEQSSQGPSQFGSSVPSQSLASERGGNWALPTQTRGATGYLRPVSLVCASDSWTIKNVAGKNVTIEVGADDTEAIDQLINIVWQRIDAWGVAGANAFWKPNLVVRVDEGAAFQFARFKQRLKNSGLGIEEASP